MKSFHSYNTVGFGSLFYHTIFSPNDSMNNVVMISDYFYNITDTIATPKNPTWFAEH